MVTSASAHRARRNMRLVLVPCFLTPRYVLDILEEPCHEQRLKRKKKTTEGVEEESCKGRRYLSPVVRPHEKGKQKQREQKRMEGGEASGCLLPISILEFQMLSEAVARRTRPSFAAPPIPFVPERWLFWARSTMLFESCHRPATTSCSRDSCNGEDAARYIEARSTIHKLLLREL